MLVLDDGRLDTANDGEDLDQVRDPAACPARDERPYRNPSPPA